MSSDRDADSRERIAVAAERIAAAVERVAAAVDLHVRSSRPAGPVPQLQARRPPTDVSDLATANLHAPENKMMVHLANVGDARTRASRPLLEIAGAAVEGAFVTSGGYRDAMTLEPGDQAILEFDLADPNASLAETITLRVVHDPARLPGAAVHVEVLEAVGLQGGRPGWEPVSTQVEPLGHGAT